MGDIACEKDSSLQELISVIIPVYKVEKYLNQCIESVVAQSYRNLEIILVDDGSPDRCPEICDMWAKKDARVRVIHKKQEDPRIEGETAEERKAQKDDQLGRSGELMDERLLRDIIQYLTRHVHAPFCHTR